MSVEWAGRVKKAMEFYPARPTRRELAPVSFLAVLVVGILATRIFAGTVREVLLGLVCSGLLIAGGVWLQLRHRFPGRPVLRVNRKGMTYLRGGNEQSLRWTEVAGISVDFTLNQMTFRAAPGAKSVVMHRNMVSANGDHWLMVMDDYLERAKAKDQVLD